ncbi:MAG: hypothetical protein ACIAS6_13365, partial [Phycisphaerales bacterium JB060]
DHRMRGVRTLPRWLVLATLGAAATELALGLLPLGRAAGNAIYWGSTRPEPRQYHATYRPAPVQGKQTPGYEIILQVTLVVDGHAEARGASAPALGGHITSWFASAPDHPTGLRHYLAYDARTDRWTFGRFGNLPDPNAPPARPPNACKAADMSRQSTRCTPTRASNRRHQACGTKHRK